MHSHAISPSSTSLATPALILPETAYLHSGKTAGGHRFTKVTSRKAFERKNKMVFVPLRPKTKSAMTDPKLPRLLTYRWVGSELLVKYRNYDERDHSWFPKFQTKEENLRMLKFLSTQPAKSTTDPNKHHGWRPELFNDPANFSARYSHTPWRSPKQDSKYWQFQQYALECEQIHKFAGTTFDDWEIEHDRPLREAPPAPKPSRKAFGSPPPSLDAHKLQKLASKTVSFADVVRGAPRTEIPPVCKQDHILPYHYVDPSVLTGAMAHSYVSVEVPAYRPSNRTWFTKTLTYGQKHETLPIKAVEPIKLSKRSKRNIREKKAKALRTAEAQDLRAAAVNMATQCGGATDKNSKKGKIVKQGNKQCVTNCPFKQSHTIQAHTYTQAKMHYNGGKITKITKFSVFGRSFFEVPNVGGGLCGYFAAADALRLPYVALVEILKDCPVQPRCPLDKWLSRLHLCYLARRSNVSLIIISKNAANQTSTTLFRYSDKVIFIRDEKQHFTAVITKDFYEGREFANLKDYVGMAEFLSTDEGIVMNPEFSAAPKPKPEVVADDVLAMMDIIRPAPEPEKEKVADDPLPVDALVKNPIEENHDDAAPPVEVACEVDVSSIFPIDRQGGRTGVAELVNLHRATFEPCLREGRRKILTSRWEALMADNIDIDHDKSRPVLTAPYDNSALLIGARILHAGYCKSSVVKPVPVVAPLVVAARAPVADGVDADSDEDEGEEEDEEPEEVVHDCALILFGDYVFNARLVDDDVITSVDGDGLAPLDGLMRAYEVSDIFPFCYPDATVERMPWNDGGDHNWGLEAHNYDPPAEGNFVDPIQVADDYWTARLSRTIEASVGLDQGAAMPNRDSIMSRAPLVMSMAALGMFGVLSQFLPVKLATTLSLTAGVASTRYIGERRNFMNIKTIGPIALAAYLRPISLLFSASALYSQFMPLQKGELRRDEYLLRFRMVDGVRMNFNIDQDLRDEFQRVSPFAIESIKAEAIITKHHYYELTDFLETFDSITRFAQKFGFKNMLCWLFTQDHSYWPQYTTSQTLTFCQTLFGQLTTPGMFADTDNETIIRDRIEKAARKSTISNISVREMLDNEDSLYLNTIRLAVIDVCDKVRKTNQVFRLPPRASAKDGTPTGTATTM